MHQSRGGSLLILAAGHRRLQAAAAAAAAAASNWSLMAPPVEVRRQTGRGQAGDAHSAAGTRCFAGKGASRELNVNLLCCAEALWREQAGERRRGSVASPKVGCFLFRLWVFYFNYFQNQGCIYVTFQKVSDSCR